MTARTALLCCCLLLSLASVGFLSSEDGNSIAFEEVAASVGLEFHHDNGFSGEFYLPEIMGGGVGLFDFDGDGDLDVYFVQSGSLKRGGEAPSISRNRLFRNLLAETGQLTFEEVEGAGGLDHPGYGMGVAVGDFSGNGFPDVYVTNFGPNALFANNGDGSFTDVTEQAGTDDVRWSTSAIFLDYDRDGLLDLFVVNYVDFTVAGNKTCFDSVGQRDYCNPNQYEGLPDRLFRNLGNGRFEDVSEASGIASRRGPGLGVTVADFNGNGLPDIFVANDGAENFLWINQGDGTFREEGLLRGVALNGEGAPEGSMGVAAGDFDDDGDLDLFMTHLTDETNTLYVNDGKGNFLDATASAGLGASSLPYTGFGAAWFDANRNGRLDLFIANGAVRSLSHLRGEEFPYHQRNQLYRNLGGGRFGEVGSRSVPALELSEVSRGAAFGDIDNDGDIDIVVSNCGGPARLLLNQTRSPNSWLLARLSGKMSAGAIVTLSGDEVPPRIRTSQPGESYLSASDSRVYFGIPNGETPNRIRVDWPSGEAESWPIDQVNAIVDLRQGSGRAEALD